MGRKPNPPVFVVRAENPPPPKAKSSPIPVWHGRLIDTARLGTTCCIGEFANRGSATRVVGYLKKQAYATGFAFSVGEVEEKGKPCFRVYATPPKAGAAESRPPDEL